MYQLHLIALPFFKLYMIYYLAIYEKNKVIYFFDILQSDKKNTETLTIRVNKLGVVI